MSGATVEQVVPRRRDVLRWTPAEHLLSACVWVVERMGADERLTTAVLKLTEAQEAVADYVDATAARPQGEFAEPREPIMRWFRYQQLPPDLQLVSRLVGACAEVLHWRLPRGAERAVALRKLVEAKDAAVRAAIPE